MNKTLWACCYRKMINFRLVIVTQTVCRAVTDYFLDQQTPSCFYSLQIKCKLPLVKPFTCLMLRLVH